MNMQLVDDDTADAILGGRYVEAEFADLVTAVEAYREFGRRPVPPRGELAARMVTGAFATAAPVRHRRPAVARTNGHTAPAAHRPKWRHRRMVLTTALATAASKIAGLGMAAKATAGITVATATLGTAGVAGALPDPVQQRFDTVVESVTPGSPAAETPPLAPGPADEADFGKRVSEDARDGGVNGEQISEEARQLGEQRRPDHAPVPEQPGKPSDLPTLPGPGSSQQAPPVTPGERPEGRPGPRQP